MAENSFIGVVMLGGQSRRMGTNKALLMRDKVNMTEFTQSCLVDAGATDILFSIPFGQSPISAKHIPDQQANLGPLGGFLAVLQYAFDHNIEDNLLFVPVDLPLLNSQTLALLAAHSLAEDNAVTFLRQPLPVLIKPSSQTLEKLKAIIKQGENLSMFHFLDAIGANAIKLTDTDTLFNSNKPEEWQHAIDKLQRQNQ